MKIPRIRFRTGGDTPEPYSPVATYYMILVSAIVLGVFGLLMTFSASSVTNISRDINPYLAFVRTLGIMAVSVLVAFVCALAKPDLIKRLTWPVYVVALVAQLAVYPFGVEQGGNKNWIRIPGINQFVQPSEFLKLATCLVLGVVLANLGSRVNDWKAVLIGVGIPAGLSVIAVMLGGDLGTALIFVAIVFGATWVAGVPLRYFVFVSVPVIALLVVMVAISPSRSRRVLEIIPGMGEVPDPTVPTQFAQGLWALGSGGLLGRGPGASHAKWNYLQEAHNDFILAIVGEEFGFVGTLSLLVALAVLVWGTLRMTSNTTNAFVSYSSAGIAAWLASQGLINVGSVTGLLPVIGVPFPLVSHGGSSFLFTAAAIGVLLAFARSEAGIPKRGRFDGETGGRDPRRSVRRRRVRRQKPKDQDGKEPRQ